MISFLKKMLKINSHNKEVICIQLSKNGLGVILAKIAPVLHVTKCKYFQGDLKTIQNSLHAFVEQNQLQYMDCHVVLSLDDYQLMLIEKPKVIESEVRESVQWLVKDLINFPIEEAIIDFFPAPTRTGQPEKIYVVIGRLERLNTIANLATNAELKLKTIDIAALTIRNLLAALHIVGNSAVLLIKDEENYHILVVKDRLVYLERKLVFHHQNELDEQKFEAFCNELVTELQRSIEFYQNREKTIPIKIFLSPSLGHNKKLVQTIETGMNLRIDVLDVNKWLSDVQDMSLDCKINCLSIIGKALGLAAPAD